MLQRKARAELEGALDGMPEADAARLLALVDLNGGDEVLDAARERLAGAGEEVDAALASLAGVAEVLRRERPGLVLHFDLAELRGYRYHTGVVFAALVPGHGEAIARGGRYDDVGRYFGRARPATGFSTDLRTLLRLGDAEATAPHDSGIFAPSGADPALCAAIRDLRAGGERVVRALPGQAGGAAEAGCDRELVRGDRGWEVAPIARP